MTETTIVWQPRDGARQTLYGHLTAESISSIRAAAEAPDAADRVLEIPLRVTPDGPTYHRLLDASRIVEVDGIPVTRAAS